jgi:transcriptional regulator with XRE-family HTH domain
MRNNKEFAEFVRDRRTEAGMTQLELAEKSDVSLRTINNIESQGNCTLESFFLVMRALENEVAIKTRVRVREKV